ncbi:MAG: TonB family protein, partial [Comamonadaceae bacterium]
LLPLLLFRAPPRPEPPVQRQPDIALEREKQRRAEEKERQQELAEKREQEKREQEKRKAEAQKKREEELARRKEEEARKVAEAKRKEDEQKKREQLEARDAKRREELRKEQIARAQAMAAGTGSADATGSAARASGPSAGWGAKVQAKVRPNIVFTDTVSGNPRAVVEVRTSPDGTIVGKRLVRSSGSAAWDEAVLRALERTGSLPRDVDGRVPSPVEIGFRPNG